MRSAEQGLAMALFLLVLIAATLASASALIRLHAGRRDAVSMRVLADAKRQLISMAVAQQPVGIGNNNRPGSLPCPDRNAPASADAGRAGLGGTVTCPSNAARLGRLPSATLSQPALRDGSGEPLWYALVRGLDNQDDTPLNDDFVPENGAPWFGVWASAGRDALSADADPVVAVLIAPGPPLPGQVRGSDAQQRNPANYLETAATAYGRFSNSDPGRARFLDGPLEGALNDRVLPIRRSEIMGPVARRAAHEYQQLLALWAASTGSWPNPADPADPGCTQSGGGFDQLGCRPDAARCRGRLPKTAALTGDLDRSAYRPAGIGAAAWSARLKAYDWLYRNRWEQQFHYAVGTAALRDAPLPGCAATPAVHGVGLPPGATLLGVMIGAGPVQSGQRRTSAADKAALANYLEPSGPAVGVDPALNRQAWDAPPARPDEYTRPGGNDSLHLLVRSNETTHWIHAD
ncbi:hypothetical protein [Jeongeupia sp. USM3]|uniref:hypothetical protein n=1 Tax=Jeongeupia sp. USM3 TaxID=1906741 RepID=UPI00089DEB6A|nr:hypothetical protein [Jeongeupia sp. USM3]AOY01292.1 hypothetical protein BJP62_13040 [Jeongeupia sp. USM3]